MIYRVYAHDANKLICNLFIPRMPFQLGSKEKEELADWLVDYLLPSPDFCPVAANKGFRITDQMVALGDHFRNTFDFMSKAAAHRSGIRAHLYLIFEMGTRIGHASTHSSNLLGSVMISPLCRQ